MTPFVNKTHFFRVLKRGFVKLEHHLLRRWVGKKNTSTCVEKVIFLPQASGELLVVHLWLVFSDPPPPGDLVGVRHFELPAVAGPGNKMLATFVREKF